MCDTVGEATKGEQAEEAVGEPVVTSLEVEGGCNLTHQEVQSQVLYQK